MDSVLSSCLVCLSTWKYPQRGSLERHGGSNNERVHSKANELKRVMVIYRTTLPQARQLDPEELLLS